MTYKVTIAFLAAITSSLFSLAQPDSKEMRCFADLTEGATFEEWDKPIVKNGVSLKYGDVQLADGCKVRQLIAEFQVEGPFENVLEKLKQPQYINQWNEGFRESFLLEDNGNGWITHFYYDFPFPLTQQDLISEYLLEEKEDGYFLYACPRPKYKEKSEDSVREEHNYSYWDITRLPGNKYQMAFRVITLSSSSVPRWIKDPFIQRSLLHSFRNLQLICEDDKALID